MFGIFIFKGICEAIDIGHRWIVCNIKERSISKWNALITYSSHTKLIRKSLPKEDYKDEDYHSSILSLIMKTISISHLFTLTSRTYIPTILPIYICYYFVDTYVGGYFRWSSPNKVILYHHILAIYIMYVVMALHGKYTRAQRTPAYEEQITKLHNIMGYLGIMDVAPIMWDLQILLNHTKFHNVMSYGKRLGFIFVRPYCMYQIYFCKPDDYNVSFWLSWGALVIMTVKWQFESANSMCKDLHIQYR